MRRMVNRLAGKDGFVNVRNESDTVVPVVGGLCVDVDEERSKGDRYYFTFAEGSNREHKVMHGKRGNVKKVSGGVDTLISDASVDPTRPAMLYVVLNKTTIESGQIRGSLYLELEPGVNRSFVPSALRSSYGPFDMVTSYSEDAEKEALANQSWYGIGFPDQPRPFDQQAGVGYRSDYLPGTTSENVWFPYYTSARVRRGSLEHDDRFIHAGSHSLGCVTVQAHSAWDHICRYLLSRRKSATLVGAMSIVYVGG
jgi:hypothetical protein